MKTITEQLFPTPWYKKYLLPVIILIVLIIGMFGIQYYISISEGQAQSSSRPSRAEVSGEKKMTTTSTIPVSKESYKIFNEFVESVFESQYITKVKPEYRVGMDTNNSPNENLFGARWNIDEKQFYAGILFKNNSQIPDLYRASVSYLEFENLDKDSALNLAKTYFKIPKIDLSCKTADYTSCKATWTDEQKNENGIFIASVDVAKTQKTLIYYCSVPVAGSLYKIKYCVDDL